jgi:membrane protein implicated in regulation of membrane protease activity
MEFLTSTPWVIWGIIAVALIIAEILISGFFILWFGLGAAAAAAVAAFFPKEIALQLLVFSIASLALTLTTRKLVLKLYAKGASQKVGLERLESQIAIVLETIDPDTGKGMVRAEHDQWRAQTEDGAAIEQGAKVQILRIEGTRLIVTKIQ